DTTNETARVCSGALRFEFLHRASPSRASFSLARPRRPRIRQSQRARHRAHTRPRHRWNRLGGASSASVPAGAQVLDLSNKTVLPGLVGMHEHMFYPSGGRIAVAIYNEMGFSFPRLYLANGVTSMRTTGSIEPYTDLEL